MSFTDAEKTNIRRFCGYGAYGGGQPLPASGYRFSTQYGILEYKMNTLSTSEESVVRTYLTNIATLESDIFGSSGVRSNLDTDQAAVWTHNKNEHKDRKALYNSARRELCSIMGITPGPALANGGMTVVV